jgi:hypothetical protein
LSTGLFVRFAVNAPILSIHNQFEEVRSDTLSTRTYDRTIVESFDGVNDIQAVVEVVIYISFLHTARLPLVCHQIDTVQVQAD